MAEQSPKQSYIAGLERELEYAKSDGDTDKVKDVQAELNRAGGGKKAEKAEKATKASKAKKETATAGRAPETRSEK